MKKIFLVMCAGLLLAAQLVFASDGKINLEFRGENFYPQAKSGKAFTKECFAGNWERDGKGLGVGIENIPELDWIRLEGAGFLKLGNIQASLGYRQEECGEEKLTYLFPEIDFLGESLGFNYCLAFKNLFSLEAKESFLDSSIFIGHPVTEKFSLGGTVIQDHYWNDEPESHEWLLAGAVARCQFNEHHAIHLRLARSWDFRGGDSSFCDQVRVSMEFHY